VSVTVSSGPSTVEVPNLAGKSHSEVRDILRAAGLKLGMIARAHSDDMSEGRIVQQYPEAGKKAERGTSVRITLSSGSQKLHRPAREDTPSGSEGEFSISNPISSFTEVVWRVVTKPAEFFSAIPRRGNFLAPLIFALICIEISTIVAGLLRFTGLTKPGYRSGEFIGELILDPVIGAIGLFVLAGIAHLLVMLFSRSVNSGFESTFKVVSYSSVVNLITWIPFVGWLLALYGLYLVVVGIREIHVTTTGKAALVILTPFAVALILLVALVVLGLLSA